MSEARLDLSYLLSEEVLPTLDRASRLWVLRTCRIAVVGSPDGWRALVDKTAVRGPDFDGAIEQALRVLKTREDLWPEAPAAEAEAS